MSKATRRPTHSFFLRTGNFLRRLVGARSRRPEIPGTEADSYVGLFQGVIENAPPAPVAPRVPPPVAARTSGFVRLEVDGQKKATGCFLFFVDGKVLTGAIEGSTQGSGVVEASFRLNRDDSQTARPVAAVGRLTLEARCPRRPAGPAEDMTIRFV